MRSRAVKVKRENIEACMKCPICYKLLKEATTISLCLHTFCRKCIFEKLSDEEVDCCPVCGINLGCLPVEKLRPDHALQDIREKVFPFKKRKMNYLTETNLPSPIVKRKERSLSSLGVSTPNVSLQTGPTGKRTKAPPRRGSGSRGNTLVFKELNKKKRNKNREDSIENIGAADLSESNQRQEPSPSAEETSLKKLCPTENIENSSEMNEEINDLWKPLNCLVEAANRPKSSSKLNPPILTSLVDATKSSEVVKHVIALPRPNIPVEVKPKAEFLDSSLSFSSLGMDRSKEGGVRVKFQDNNNNGSSSALGPVKRRCRPTQKKKVSALENLSTSAQRLLDASQGSYNRQSIPIWFSLVACKDRKGEASLPQISSGYLRIKDCNIPVSVIQKYVVQKLHLSNESEVEIHCRGQPVLPTLHLHHLVDLWFRTAATSGRVSATLGTPATDFVMVLSYCRKPSTTID